MWFHQRLKALNCVVSPEVESPQLCSFTEGQEPSTMWFHQRLKALNCVVSPEIKGF